MTSWNQRNTFELSPYLHKDGVAPAPEDSANSASKRNAGGDNDPMRLLYARLAKMVPKLPRDVDGGVDADAFRALLGYVGIDTDRLELEGYVELLARCDLSPAGFPSFDDFARCIRIEMPHSARGVETLLSAHDPSMMSDRRSRDAEELARLYARRSAEYARAYNGGNLSPEELAKIYARGARLHASQMHAGHHQLPRHGMNTAELPITAEVLARVPGGSVAMPGPLSRPDGYRLDTSGTYMGTLPGMAADASEWPPVEYKEVLAEGGDGTWGWVVKGEPKDISDGGAGAGRGGTRGGDDDYDWLKTSPFGSLYGGSHTGDGKFGNSGRADSRAAGPVAVAGGEKLLNPMSGGHSSSTSGKQSDRRSYHVARGDAIVPSPNKAGPASNWRKFR